MRAWYIGALTDGASTEPLVCEMLLRLAIERLLQLGCLVVTEARAAACILSDAAFIFSTVVPAAAATRLSISSCAHERRERAALGLATRPQPTG